MSWKFGGIYIRKDFSSNWNELRNRLDMQEAPTSEHISWSGTTRFGFEDTALGVWNGCTMVHDHGLVYSASFDKDETYELDELCEKLSLEADVLCFLVDGMTTTGAFSWYHAGRRVRIYNNVSGKLVTDFGSLLPSEAKKPGENEDPEERIMGLLGFMVGASFQDLLRINPDMIICR